MCAIRQCLRGPAAEPDTDLRGPGVYVSVPRRTRNSRLHRWILCRSTGPLCPYGQIGLVRSTLPLPDETRQKCRRLSSRHPTFDRGHLVELIGARPTLAVPHAWNHVELDGITHGLRTDFLYDVVEVRDGVHRRHLRVGPALDT